MSRALLTTLALGSLAAACQNSHPVIAAPYGAPPPLDVGARPRVQVPTAASWLVTLPDPITMAMRARIPLEIVASNLSDSAIDPGRGRIRFRVNGESSPVLDMAFGNGVMLPHWESLPPHATVRDQRMVLETIMPTPGEYLVELTIDGQRVAARRVTVVP